MGSLTLPFANVRIHASDRFLMLYENEVAIKEKTKY